MFTAGKLLLATDTTTEKEVNLSLYHYKILTKGQAQTKRGNLFCWAAVSQIPQTNVLDVA